MRNFGELPSGHIDLSRPKSNPRFVLGVNRSGLFFGVVGGPVFGRGSELKNRNRDTVTAPWLPAREAGPVPQRNVRASIRRVKSP